MMCILCMDGLRDHGPLGLDMLKPPPLREELCTRKTRTHTQTPLGVYTVYILYFWGDLTVELDTLAIVLGK